ncbi:MAG: PIG-L family deacetylase [Nitrospirae bacterium]|nr:PIG-L family deacetylase [Nitrospirota bacterium]
MRGKTSFYRVLFVLLTVLFFSSLANANILVISPHPDDDVITSSGVVSQALERGEPVKIVYMTNGDYAGVATGYTRQNEAVSAQSYLGAQEDDLIFLGYPDGYLSTLFNGYYQESDQFTAPNGRSTTYANRGLGRIDYHSYRFGFPAAYNSLNILLDLEDIIASYKPDHIFTTSALDVHPDHSTSNILLKLAVVRVHNNDPDYTPTIHNAFVWTLDSHDYYWPNPLDPSAYFTEFPSLVTPPGVLWSDRESIDVPLAMQSTYYESNPKYLAVSAYVSQNGMKGFLEAFIHKDEVFWTENIFGGNQPPVPAAGFDQTVSEGVPVYLDGSGSHDPDGDPLLFDWIQSGGIPVELSNSSIANPSFTAPANLSQDETLTFQLVVDDGGLTSIPDSVNINVKAPLIGPNIAPLAAVTASSEASQNGQTAVKAVDGVIDGYPGDYTREWATNGQGSGAWIRLNWGIPYNVSRVILYDRPNPYDRILSATLTFSDGSTIQVGALNNTGAAVEYSFTPRVITSLTLTVNTVSGTTHNIGLSEIQVFGINQYSLTVAANPSGAGVILKNPDKTTYNNGEKVTLSALPNAGYAFSTWSGDESGNQNPVTITMDTDKVVTADFVVLPGSLTVTPSDGLSASGIFGGPFSPSSYTYQLQNSGGTTINWTASQTKKWVTLSSSGGTLSPGASTTVDVSINNMANRLFSGLYNDVVYFSNTTNGTGDTKRSVDLTISKAIQIYTISTNPAGLKVIVDGIPYTAPRRFVWAVGSSHTLAVSSPQAVGSGIRYIYNSWDDSGAQKHIITVPSSATTYTANFTTQYRLTTIVNKSKAGTVTPSDETWYNGGQSVPITASANKKYSFSNWSGDLSGSINPSSIVMTRPRTVIANFDKDKKAK